MTKILSEDHTQAPLYQPHDRNTGSHHGDPIIFSAANGFPVATYGEFLTQFALHYHVTGIDCCAVERDQMPPTKDFSFARFADELLEKIESLVQEPVIAMGHSFGAHVSLIAACKRPELFKGLVLIEPASLPNRWLDLVYRKLPKSILHKMIPMIPNTENRQRVWDDRESFKLRYQSHPTYAKMTEEAMNAYATHGLREITRDKFELVFSPFWEAHIFRQVPYVWNNLKKTDLPCLFVKAEHSNLYSSQHFLKQNRKLKPNFTGIEVPSTYHLMPLEAPKVCFDIVENWLSKTL